MFKKILNKNKNPEIFPGFFVTFSFLFRIIAINTNIMNRKYTTLKFICDKQFSENATEIDVELRKTIIREYEDELHVCFSWRKIFEWSAYLLITGSLLAFTSKIFFVVLGISIISFLVSKILVNKYITILRYYNMSVALIDLEIYRKTENLVPEIKQ